MAEKPLDFVQFDVIYTRQGVSNKWTRRIERNADPVKKYIEGVQLFIVKFEGEDIKNESRARCMVHVKCDPLLNDPNTSMIPEAWGPYEEEALKSTDYKFKKRHPKAEFMPLP